MSISEQERPKPSSAEKAATKITVDAKPQQIGAQLDMWSEVGAGTEIELRLPGPIAYRTSPVRWWHRLQPVQHRLKSVPPEENHER